MSGLFGGSTSKTRGEDLKDPALNAPNQSFASLLLGLLGATEPQVGSTRGPGKDPQKVVAPNTNPLGGIPRAPQHLLDPASITEDEMALLGQLRQQTGPGTARAQAIDATLAGQGANPFLQQFIEAAQRPTLQGLEEVLSRTLPGRFTMAGQNVNPGQSSAFDRAAAIATRGAAQSLADIATQISFGAFEGERERQMQAIQFSQQEVDHTIKSLQAHALPRLIEQFGLDQGLAEHQRQTQTLIQLLSILQGVSAPALAQQTTERRQEGVLPAIGMAAGGISGFMPNTDKQGTGG